MELLQEKREGNSQHIQQHVHIILCQINGGNKFLSIVANSHSLSSIIIYQNNLRFSGCTASVGYLTLDMLINSSPDLAQRRSHWRRDLKRTFPLSWSYMKMRNTHPGLVFEVQRNCVSAQSKTSLLEEEEAEGSTGFL